MIYKQWEVVAVPFPFVDSIQRKKRPVLVLSNSKFNKTNKHFIGAMITTAKGVKWENDIEIDDITTAGLPVKSFIRPKIFTLDNRLVSKKIGSISEADTKKAEVLLTEIFQNDTIHS